METKQAGALGTVVLILHSGRVVEFSGLGKSWRISSLYLHRCATNPVLVLQLPKENSGCDSKLKPGVREGKNLGKGGTFRLM